MTYKNVALFLNDVTKDSFSIDFIFVKFKYDSNYHKNLYTFLGNKVILITGLWRFRKTYLIVVWF